MWALVRKRLRLCHSCSSLPIKTHSNLLGIEQDTCYEHRKTQHAILSPGIQTRPCPECCRLYLFQIHSQTTPRRGPRPLCEKAWVSSWEINTISPASSSGALESGKRLLYTQGLPRAPPCQLLAVPRGQVPILSSLSRAQGGAWIENLLGKTLLSLPAYRSTFGQLLCPS